jgi:Domain of unknown function (DU1801)
MQTSANDGDVAAFLAGVENVRRREDAQRVAALMAEVTGSEPRMRGTAIVGFGDSEYTNTSGTHPWFAVGLSPRKAALTLYVLGATASPMLGRLGPHTTGKGRLYIKDLSTVDEAVLRDIIKQGWEKS